MMLQLNPTFETFFLLPYSNSGESTKKEVIKQLNELGINGAAFYAANYPLIERYHDAFVSQAVKTDGSAIFEDMCGELAVLLITILFLHPEWLDDSDASSDEEVATVVRETIASLLESDKDIIEALDASDLSDQAKWQITTLLQQPKKKLALVIETINANLAAFEYAYTKLEPEIAPLLEQFERQLERNELSSSINQVLTLNSDAKIIPSMAASLTILAFDEYSFIGLLLNKIMIGQDESLTEAEAALVAKSLSDASKLKILRVLKNDRLYNLEIAQKLGLTPATTSHHMNILLAAGLVEISKEGAKAYYRTCGDGIERYRNWLDETFLQDD